jgi:hypothetical protein
MIDIISSHPWVVHALAAVFYILKETFPVLGTGSTQAVYGIHQRIETGAGTQAGGDYKEYIPVFPGAAYGCPYTGQAGAGDQNIILHLGLYQMIHKYPPVYLLKYPTLKWNCIAS